MSIMDPITIGPLILQPSDTQGTGGYMTIEILSAEGHADPWAYEGGTGVQVDLTTWEQAQEAARAER